MALPGESVAALRERLIYQEYWRSLGTWSPDSWRLDFAVVAGGEIVGVQTLEAENFPSLRTVDSGSWLTRPARRRGIGVSMRRAVLALAFDRLGALAAISSARTGNAASLGVSRRLGYTGNGVTLNSAAGELFELQHVRLTAGSWRASGQGSQVSIDGFDPCRSWFGL